MRTTKRNIRFLTRAEIRKIIDKIPDNARGRRDRALLEVLFSTGLRISEALALEREKFLLASNYDQDERLTLEHNIIGKGGYQRVIYFSPVALRAIKVYLNKIVNTTEDAKGRLFPITPRQAQRMVKARAVEAGIDKFVSPHIFRHSLATDLLSQGVDIRFVSEFLGHRSLNNTMIYTHVVNNQLKSIHEKLYK